jgi:chromosome segregation ATPase
MEIHQLRETLKKTVDALKRAEVSFYEARHGSERARLAASATDTLRARAQHESASDQVLEKASEVETALAEYREKVASDYAGKVQAATTASRQLHEERREAEQRLRDLDQQIQAATERERPLVSTLAAIERRDSEYAAGVHEFKLGVVRAISEDKARAA